MGVGAASAESPPPAPGQPGCVGHATAFYAHFGRDVDQTQRERGLGQLAQYNDVTVGDIHQYAAADCGLLP